MPKINREEYEVLKGLDDKWKWIARDEVEASEDHSVLGVYGNEPYKSLINKWWLPDDETDLEGSDINPNLFQFIQWEDEEPYNIAELIEGYEFENVLSDEERFYELYDVKESEETEVKKRELIKNIKSLAREVSQQWPHEEMVELPDVLRGIDQLDEPETSSQIDKLANFITSEVEGEPSQNQGAVDTAIRIIKSYQNQETLSQEWIDEHAEHYEYFGYAGVPIDHLQNLLVPKQELPVIPKFVAEWIESRKNNYPFDVIGAYLRMNEPFANEQTREVLNWVHESKLNRGSFARAWTDGYEVEKEQKYFAKIKGHENISSDDKYWNYCITDESLDIGDNKVHADVLAEYVLNATKDEWENLGINDGNADFVKVEELEE